MGCMNCCLYGELRGLTGVPWLQENVNMNVSTRSSTGRLRPRDLHAICVTTGFCLVMLLVSFVGRWDMGTKIDAASKKILLMHRELDVAKHSQEVTEERYRSKFKKCAVSYLC